LKFGYFLNPPSEIIQEHSRASPGRVTVPIFHEGFHRGSLGEQRSKLLPEKLQANPLVAAPVRATIAVFFAWRFLRPTTIACGISITVRVVTVGRTVAIFINAVVAVGFAGGRRTTICRAIALILIRTAVAIAAERRRPTVYPAIVTILVPFAETVATTVDGRTVPTGWTFFLRMTIAITHTLEADITCSTLSAYTI
jgi:hypothetical protein